MKQFVANKKYEEIRKKDHRREGILSKGQKEETERMKRRDQACSQFH